MTTAHTEITRPPARPLQRLRIYASFVRFEHTLFSLPLILAGVFSAAGPPMSLGRWVLVGVAAVGARSAALALNRLIDARLDALNPRTRSRELPAGRMRASEAWLLLAGSSAAYLAACAALGPWYLRVAAVPLAVFALYPYLKRVTPLCHFGVGAALALAPLAGFAAAHPDLRDWAPAALLAVFAFLWVSGFDIIYATLDEDFDRAHGVRSLVAWLGRKRALWASGMLHVAAFLVLVFAVRALSTTAPLFIGWAPWGYPALVVVLAGAGVLLYLEQRWAEDVNLAFFKVNVAVGFAVLAVVLLARVGER
ncbi:MAG TPA: 4-hydroxybenzoate octaprenyltransferase [Candidatus Limnocylindria bacterium]|nr:4-hydroxybenzoate octaprenyltransferase [Candidatus Limnocylindria bacterium]